MAIKVPVKAIDCAENGEEMNGHLLDALKEKTFPEIAYQLDQYTMAGKDTAKTTGKLTIAGLTRPISFDVRLVQSAQGVRVTADTTIDMTLFKIVPPSLWAGMLNVGKDVRVMRVDAVLPASQ